MTVAGTMFLLEWISLHNATVLERSGKAFAHAMTCAENGLLELFENNAYSGGEVLEFEDGSCRILRTGGMGNENRTLCAEGRSGSSVRRMEIVIDRILPSIQVYAWQETDNFSFCEYE